MRPRRPPDPAAMRSPRWWWGAVALAFALALLPLDLKAPLVEPGFSAWELPQRVYQLIKPGILWAALGLIGGIANLGLWFRLGGVVCAVGLLLVAPFLPGSMTAADVVEALAVLPGLALGLWLGEGTRSHSESGLSPEQSGRAQGALLQEGGASAVGARPARDIFLGVLVASLLGGAAWAVLDFPRWSLALGVGFAIYLAVLWRHPHAWLFVVPAALPVLDLAFWTGRYYFDEFDALMLATLAAWLWHRRAVTPQSSAWPPASWLLALSVLLGTVIALVPLPPVDANAFSSYWSPFNALRLAKGFLWGAVLYAMARPAIQAGRAGLLAAGMVAGLLGVSIAALWESWLFTGFVTDSDYRVTATFSSMHTGGGHIEAYLAAVLPFAWFLLVSERRAWVRMLAVLAFLLAGYAILTTVARGGLLAFLAVLLVLAAVSVRSLSSRGSAKRGVAVAAGAMAAGVVVVALGVAGGTFLQQRIAQTATDAGIRVAHWTAALHAMDRTPRAWLLGEGLGSFPRRYVFAHAEQALGMYRVGDEAGNRFLSLNSGGTLYMAQAVRVQPNAGYTVELDLRADGQSRAVELSLCEKKLFNSHHCQWGGASIEPGADQWQHVTWAFNSGEVGAGNWLTRRPVQLSLYNPAERSMVDIDNVRLLDARGEDLLINGDFGHGLDGWFFKSGDHLPWHIKNLWVHTLFEQGLLGLLALGVLVLVAGVRLGRAAWRGDVLAATLLASLAALMVVGAVDSLVDTPRLAALLVFVLLCGSRDNAPRP